MYTEWMNFMRMFIKICIFLTQGYLREYANIISVYSTEAVTTCRRLFWIHKSKLIFTKISDIFTSTHCLVRVERFSLNVLWSNKIQSFLWCNLMGVKLTLVEGWDLWEVWGKNCAGKFSFNFLWVSYWISSSKENSMNLD
jgi:hypothetical protein